MKIRLAERGDLERIREIYAGARAFMAASGNPTQWGAHYPPEDLIEYEIAQRRLYVLTDAARVCGVFAFYPGPDPDYAQLEEGAWRSDAPYGVIHRVAGDGTVHGVVDAVVRFCWDRIPHLRIDTHRDNLVMQRSIARNGFLRCGTIRHPDGSARIVYEKLEV